MTLHTYSELISLFQDTPGDFITKGVLDSDWLLLVNIIPVLLFIFSSLLDKNIITWLGKVVYSGRYASTSFRNRSPGSKPEHTMLILASLMAIASTAYFCETLYSFQIFSLSGFSLWLVNLLIIAISLGIRYAIINFIGKFTGTGTAFEEYGYNIAQLYKFLAVPLSIINFFILYLDIINDNILIGIAVIFILNLLAIRIIRLFFVFIRRGFSLLYLILYLCALEFTPIMVFAKYLSGAV